MYQGTKLFLVGRRKPRSDGTPGPFQFEPYAYRGREYLPRYMRKYKDESGRFCRSVVICIGTCKSNKERDPSQYQINRAMGYAGDAQDCYEACGYLPRIDIILHG